MSGAPGVNGAPPVRAVAAREAREAVFRTDRALRTRAVLVTPRDRSVPVATALC